MSNIIQGFPNPIDSQYKVYINSCTYNQSKYIEDCLNGVIIQKTDFPFVHHVIDDASTDGEQEVINAWIEKNCDLMTAEYYDNDVCSITIAKSPQNPNYTLVAYFLKKNLWKKPLEKEGLFKPWQEVCEYEALCEGDDYWIDHLKLTKQAFFLDNNPDYGMIRSDSCRFFQTNGIMEKNVFEENIIRNCQDTLKAYVIRPAWLATCTWLFRLPIHDHENIPDNCFKGDLSIMLFIINKYKIKYIPDPTAVYRVLDVSASHFPDIDKARNFWASQVNTRCYYAKSLSNIDKLMFIIRIIKDSRHYYIVNSKTSPLKFKDCFCFLLSVIKKIY